MRYIIKDTPCGQIRGADTLQGYSSYTNIAYAHHDGVMRTMIHCYIRTMLNKVVALLLSMSNKPHCHYKNAK